MVFKEGINDDMDHKFKNLQQNNQSGVSNSPQESPPLPCDAEKENSSSIMKYFSLLVSLKDQRRTNNNRIIHNNNVSNLILIIYSILIFLPILCTTAGANAENTDLIHPNAKSIQFHESSSSVLVPVQTSVSYSKAYSESNKGYTKNQNQKIRKSRNGTKIHNASLRNREKNSTTLPDIITSKIQLQGETPSSISRPFYTKITSDDAIAKPSNYFGNIFRLSTSSTSTSKPKENFSLQSNLPKPSKLYTSEKDSVAFTFTPSTDKSFLTSTTSRSNDSSISSFLTTNTDSGPKIRLEPFFNLLTNFQSLALGTSKEQKFSPSYQTITQSINENTKRYKSKSTKGMREKKRNKSRHRNRIHKEDGPIPITLPKLVIDPTQGYTDIQSGPKKSTLHPMDILSVPMMPTGSESSKTSEQSFTEHSITREILDGHNLFDTEGDHDNYPVQPHTFIIDGSDLRNQIGFGKYEHNNNENATASEGPGSRERRLRSGDFLDNFHDQDVDLQAEESEVVMQTERMPIEEMPSKRTKGRSKKKKRKGSGRHVNIPQGFTTPTNIEADPSHYSEQERFHENPEDFNPITRPQFFSTIYSANNNKEDINMISKYPVSFSYNPASSNNHFHDQRLPPRGPPPRGPPPPGHGRIRMAQLPNPPNNNNKLRPNLHSFNDPHYHNFVAQGETNEYSGSNNQYRPNHNYNGYGNHPTGLPESSHYNGHTLTGSVGQQNQGGEVIRPQSSPGQQPVEATSDLDKQGSSSDTTFNVETDKISDSNQRIGIMHSFELFYTEYKLLVWASFLIMASLALLCLLVYIYVNNPPTEVVTARESYLNIDNLLGNQQILKFLTNLVESNNQTSGNGRKKRKRFKKESMQRDSQPLAAQIFSKIKKDL